MDTDREDILVEYGELIEKEAVYVLPKVNMFGPGIFRFKEKSSIVVFVKTIDLLESDQGANSDVEAIFSVDVFAYQDPSLFTAPELGIKFVLTICFVVVHEGR